MCLRQKAVCARSAGGARAGSVLMLTVAGAASEAPSLSPFTATKAQTGRVEFKCKCSSRHLPGPDGNRPAPSLMGLEVIKAWSDRRVRDLSVRMRDGIPPIGVRPREDDYTNVLAFLLQAKRLAAGAEPLDPLSYRQTLARPLTVRATGSILTIG